MTCGTLNIGRPATPAWQPRPTHPALPTMYAWGFGWAAEDEGRKPVRRRRPGARRRPSRSRK
jgi:hypothetical protein